MKSFLLIVGVAVAFAKNDCGYTVVRGPHPSECGNDQGWTTPKSRSLLYRRTRLKVFETDNHITIDEAHSLCEFHCSTVANASYLHYATQRMADLGFQKTAWTGDRSDTKCGTLSTSEFSVNVDCSARYPAVLCERLH